MADQSGTLWIVATPIGSMEDLSVRAREILGKVDLILAEDTRHSRKLLNALKISTRGRMLSLHEHNEARKLDEILLALRGGASAALISDAGTPALSDPGFLLIRAAREEKLPVASLPGPSAFITALAASGLPPLPSTLVGFLPPRKGPRRRRLGEFANIPWTLVFFLSPHRLEAELRDTAELLGENRMAALLAELSKRHERIELSSLTQLCSGREVSYPRGEYVLVVGPKEPEASPEAPTPAQARLAYDEALKLVPDRRMAQRSAAQKLGISRRELYSLLLHDEKKV